jgi:uncharacterized protein YbjT (DUF2867 family)
MNQTKPQFPIRLLVLGATGAVGGQVLALALADSAIATVVAPTRKALAPHRKLENVLVDFDQIDDSAAWLAVDAVICALGTTIKLAGSQAAFAKIDLDLPLQFARLTQSKGARRYCLVSSLGASAGGNFYLKTKAAAEVGVSTLGFDSVTLVRPSLIDTQREHARAGEQLGLFVARLFKPVIPKQYQAVAASRIAQALLDGAKNGTPGVHIIESKTLQGLS